MVVQEIVESKPHITGRQNSYDNDRSNIQHIYNSLTRHENSRQKIK